MGRNRKKLYMILGIALCIISVITIAYAALSATVTIQFSNVTQTQQTWSITLTKNSCTLTSTAAGESGTSASSACDATVSGTVATFGNLALSKPDDKCDCTFTITNAGTIKAKLSSLAWTNPTTLVPSGTTCTKNGGTMTCGNIVYTVTTDGSTVLTTSNFGTLNGSNATKTIHVTAKATALATAEVKQTNAKLALVIGQY